MLVFWHVPKDDERDFQSKGTAACLSDGVPTCVHRLLHLVGGDTSCTARFLEIDGIC